MSEISKHTPTPWLRQTIDDDGAVCIIGGDLGGLVGAALPWPTEVDAQDFSRVEANAHLIVRAVNNHDALVKALEAAVAAIGDWSRPTGANGMTSASASHPLCIAAKQGAAALLQAKEG